MENIEEFEELCKPLIEFLKENYDYHTSIIINNDSAKIVRDEIGISIEVED